jgi:hypothetical protein
VIGKTSETDGDSLKHYRRAFRVIEREWAKMGEKAVYLSRTKRSTKLSHSPSLNPAIAFASDCADTNDESTHLVSQLAIRPAGYPMISKIASTSTAAPVGN